MDGIYHEIVYSWRECIVRLILLEGSYHKIFYSRRECFIHVRAPEGNVSRSIPLSAPCVRDRWVPARRRGDTGGQPLEPRVPYGRADCHALFLLLYQRARLSHYAVRFQRQCHKLGCRPPQDGLLVPPLRQVSAEAQRRGRATGHHIAPIPLPQQSRALSGALGLLCEGVLPARS